MQKLKLMPVLAIALGFAAISATQSCNKVADALAMDIPMQSGTVTITIPPSADTMNTNQVGSGTNTLNIDSVIKASTQNILGINNIKSVKLTSCKVTIIQNASDANNFANFQSCYASVSSNSNTTPYQLTIPNNTDTRMDEIDLPVDANAELKSYLTGSTYNYYLGGKLRRALTDSLKCTVQFTYKISVKG